jgi:hypothetical protein
MAGLGEVVEEEAVSLARGSRTALRSRATRCPEPPRARRPGSRGHVPAAAQEVGVQQRHATNDRPRVASVGEVVEEVEELVLAGARHPLQRAPRVVVSGGERVLRGEAVVHGHREDAGPGRQRVDVVVIRGAERRFHHERAAVEVEEHGEPLAVVGVVDRRQVDARPEAEPGRRRRRGR